MKVSGIASDTGEAVAQEISDVSVEELQSMATLGLSSGELKARIDNLAVSADAKVLLFQVATKVIRVGETVVKIGQKILETVFEVIKTYPNTSFGVVFGAIAGTLVSSIPIIGWVLGPVITPLLVVFGMTVGVAVDIADKAAERSIRTYLARFEPLKS
ncbi:MULTISPECIES: hypothetical protein [unclassified Ruegeria]|uniref:hypothetical protein n=1 Tax=unclassified Ruegeria TaxID=2625375 RepID=UPI001492209F|nr:MULTISPECIES: hypothetical protein [unclassified Ruegeria]NOD49990.1 hypothetical protein [Ruegeria sp. HKCCD5849]NOD54298.1 hypothetical protein [Ruegeria sp. HKCCD5851]NOD70282.1 hypothetical protein [Ruegeria sp. HKCCD7303]